MPSTVNGIGTTYYGKSNLEKQYGTCENCGFNGELLEYDTTKWFVFVFIPIIPLGKHHLFDYCQKCTHHRSLPIQEWETVGENAIDDSLEKVKLDPDNPTNSISAHSALFTFNRKEEAEQMAEQMETKFKDNVDVLMYLGAFYDQIGKTEQGDKCFDRALEVAPDNKGARKAVAIGHIQKGNLEKARLLLDFMMERCPEQDAGTLYLLASAYQRNSQHPEAVAIFDVICRFFPSIARQDKQFRKAVKQSELAVGSTESILPLKPKNYGWLFVVGAVMMVVGILFFVNSYLKSNQTLFVVNGFKGDATVSIDGVGSVKVGTDSWKELDVPEGDLVAEVTAGGVTEKVNFKIENSLFERFTGAKTFILNSGKSSVLFWQKVTYRVNPIEEEDPYTIYVGDDLITLHDIDYEFVEYPETISLDNGVPKKKTRVSIIKGPPQEMINILNYYRDKAGVKEDSIVAYAERHLNDDPANEALLTSYVVKCTNLNKMDRCKKFLATLIERKPINIELHRRYQELLKADKKEAELVKKYEELLKKSPDNSALLYLRGRIEPTIAKSRPYYEKSIKADKNNPYPYYAMGYSQSTNGEYEKALINLTKACELKKDSNDMIGFKESTLLALKRYKELEKISKDYLKKNQMDYISVNQLIQIYIVQGKKDRAREVLKEYKAAVDKSKDNKFALTMYEWLNSRYDYLTKDWKKYLEFAKEGKEEKARNASLFRAYLEMGDITKAEAAFKNSNLVEDADSCLLMWLGIRLSTRSKYAAPWMKKALKFYPDSTTENSVMRKLLSGKEKEVYKQLTNYAVYPATKVILATVFAELYPDERENLTALAEKINYTKYFPYYFLKSSTQKLNPTSALKKIQ